MFNQQVIDLLQTITLAFIAVTLILVGNRVDHLHKAKRKADQKELIDWWQNHKHPSTGLLMSEAQRGTIIKFPVTQPAPSTSATQTTQTTQQENSQPLPHPENPASQAATRRLTTVPTLHVCSCNGCSRTEE